MKTLKVNEVKNLSFKARNTADKNDEIFKMLLTLAVGEALLLEPSEWKNKSKPNRGIIPKKYFFGGKDYKYRTVVTPDGEKYAFIRTT